MMASSLKYFSLLSHLLRNFWRTEGTEVEKSSLMAFDQIRLDIWKREKSL